MFSVPEWLDRAKSRAGIESDYRLSKMIGTTHSAVSAYRTGVRMPDERVILKLCALSGDDPEHVAACLQSMRAANDDAADLWRRVAARLAGGANVMLLTGMTAFLIATFAGWTDAAAATLSAGWVGVCILCLMAWARLVWRLARLPSRKLPAVGHFPTPTDELTQVRFGQVAPQRAVRRHA